MASKPIKESGGDKDRAPMRWATLAGSADHVKCAPRTIRRLIDTGQLTGYRIGKRILRIDLNELDALLQSKPPAGAA